MINNNQSGQILSKRNTRCSIRGRNQPKRRNLSACTSPSGLFSSLSEPLLAAALTTHEATCATPSPGQMVVSKASGAAETCQNNLLQQVSANCLREPRQRRRVPALPGREQISSFCGGSVEGAAPKHNRTISEQEEGGQPERTNSR